MHFKNADRQPWGMDHLYRADPGADGESDPCFDDYSHTPAAIDDRAVTISEPPARESWFSEFISDGGTIVHGNCHCSAPSPRMRMANLRAAAATGSNNLDCETAVSGIAAPYETVSSMADRSGNAVVYRRGCFAASLASGKRDIFVLHNFLESRVIGRTRSGSAAIWETAQGLEFEVTPPNTFWMRDLLVSLDRKDVSAATCLCIPVSSTIETRGDQRVRAVTEADLILISITAFPPFSTPAPLSVKQQQQQSAAALTPQDKEWLSTFGVQGRQF